MAEKSKSKTTRGKAKAAKPTEAKTAKAADPASSVSKASPAKTAGKTAAVKTTAKAGKKPKAKAGKAAKPSKTATPAAEKHDEQHAKHGVAPESETFVDTFYVCSGVLPIEIRDTPPASGTRSVEFSSFGAARDHFLSELIEAIEHYERVLHAVRSAANFADYLDQQG